jgi:hypothetical protein
MGNKRYHIAVTITIFYKIKQHFPFQGTPKYTQIEIFGMQMYHLATLLQLRSKRR